VLGLVAGALVGRACQLAVGRESQSASAAGGALCTTMMVTGAFLGWQGAAMFGVFSLPLLIVTRLVAVSRPSRLPAMLLVWLPALIAFLLLWSWLDQNSIMIGVHGWTWSSLTWWQDWLLALFGLVGVCVGLSLLPGRAAQTSDSTA